MLSVVSSFQPEKSSHIALYKVDILPTCIHSFGDNKVFNSVPYLWSISEYRHVTIINLSISFSSSTADLPLSWFLVSACLFPFLYIMVLGIELGALCFATELCHQPNFFSCCLFVYSSFLVLRQFIYVYPRSTLEVLCIPIWSWNHCGPWRSLTHNPRFCSLHRDI